MTGEFPLQRGSNAENISIWWRHNILQAVPSRMICAGTGDQITFFNRRGMTTRHFTLVTGSVPIMSEILSVVFKPMTSETQRHLFVSSDFSGLNPFFLEFVTNYTCFVASSMETRLHSRQDCRYDPVPMPLGAKRPTHFKSIPNKVRDLTKFHDVE